MAYDLTVFSRDLQDRLDWLVKEVGRLQEENARLIDENEALREEVTLARLFRDVAPTPGRSAAGDGASDAAPRVSREAIEFYHHLPERFNFTEFFDLAEVDGIDSDAARDFVLLYFREGMLRQEGAHIAKTGSMPYPRRLAQ